MRVDDNERTPPQRFAEPREEGETTEGAAAPSASGAPAEPDEASRPREEAGPPEGSLSAFSDEATGSSTDVAADRRHTTDRPDAEPAEAPATDTATRPDTGMTTRGTTTRGTNEETNTAGVLGKDVAEVFRRRWRELQAEFVDDPAGATATARDLLEDVAVAWTEAIAARRTNANDRHERAAQDTEALRTTWREYHAIAVRLLET